MSTTESEKDSDEVLKLAQQLDSSLQHEDVNAWVNVDSNDQGYQLLSDEDIIKQVTQTNNAEVTEEEDEDESEDVPSSGEVCWINVYFGMRDKINAQPLHFFC